MTDRDILISDGPSPLDMGISLFGTHGPNSRQRPVVRFTLEHPSVRNILPCGRWIEAVIDGLHRVGGDRVEWNIEGTIVDVSLGLNCELRLMGLEFTALFSTARRRGMLHLVISE
jgi:hypothetical protein